MMNLKVIVPVLVIALKIVMKLFVGRRTEPKNYFELLCELPTDIIFLSFSFSLAYFFLDEVTMKETASISIGIVILSIVIVAIFRECRFISEGKITSWKVTLLLFLIALNYFLSLSCLYYSTNTLLSTKNEISKEQRVKK
jgi:hypothetical protein